MAPVKQSKAALKFTFFSILDQGQEGQNPLDTTYMRVYVFEIIDLDNGIISLIRVYSNLMFKFFD